MGTRVTLRGLALAILTAKKANPAVVIVFNAHAVKGNKQLKFYGVVNVGGVDYDLAGTNRQLESRCETGTKNICKCSCCDLRIRTCYNVRICRTI